MKCMFCQSEMKMGTTSYHVDRNGYHLSLDAIPAWVCSQCGETLFEKQEVDEIQDTIRLMDDRAVKVHAVA